MDSLSLESLTVLTGNKIMRLMDLRLWRLIEFVAKSQLKQIRLGLELSNASEPTNSPPPTPTTETAYISAISQWIELKFCIFSRWIGSSLESKL